MKFVNKFAAPSGAKSSREYMNNVHKHAAFLRVQAGVSALERINPYQLAGRFHINIASIDDLKSLPAEDKEHIKSIDAKVWSGAGIPLPNDTMVVLLHPNQTQERENITIMEEVLHSYFKHEPTSLTMLPGGLMKRTYNELAEKEAYWTAAATLLPAEAVTKLVWKREGVELLAGKYGVSTELVIFRIKTLNLWSDYKKYMPS